MVAPRRSSSNGRGMAALVVTVLSMLWVFFGEHLRPEKVGNSLFDVLLGVAIAGVAVGGGRAADLFADERRYNTLGVLFSTGIRPAEVLVGKLLATMLVPLSQLLALAPGLLIACLHRGATVGMCFAAVAILLAYMMLSVSVNFYFSLIFEEQNSARTVAEITLLALIGIIPIVNWINMVLTGKSLADGVLAISPAYAAWVLITDRIGSVHELAWVSCATTAFLAVVFFSLGARLLGRVWRDQTAGLSENGDLLDSWRRKLRNRTRELAKPFLEESPYAWLVSRDFSPRLTVHFITCGLLALWTLGWLKWGIEWLKPVNFWVTIALLSTLLRWSLNHLAARQIGEDRSSGTLELMLTTPMPPQKIIAGQSTVLNEFMKHIRRNIAVLGAVFFILGWVVRPMQGQALLNYVLISFGVIVAAVSIDRMRLWLSFWMSLNTGRPGLVFRRQLWQQGAFLSVYLQAVLHRNKLNGIPNGTVGETIVAATAATIALIFIFSYFHGLKRRKRSDMESKSEKFMREIAAEPVPEASEPRLKSWDYSRPLLSHQTLDDKILV